MHEPAELAAARQASRYSVAICTYNGERFVEAQLDSVLAAHPSCEEIVLIDDASQDKSLAIARRVLDRVGVRTVIERNARNGGSLRSFERALGLTNEPIVFLADQDDLWHRDKPARMLAEFERRPDLLLLHSDARLVDDAGRPIGPTLLGAIEASAFERDAIHRGAAFDALIRRNLATGATMALRRSLLDVALPIPDGWVHDEWLAIVASAIGTVDFLDAPLIDYRQHANNQIGARKLSYRDKVDRAFDKPDEFYALQIERTTALLDRLVALGPRVLPERLDALRNKLVHLHIRAGLPRNRLARLIPIVGQWLSGGYQRYSTGVKSVLRDLFHAS